MERQGEPEAALTTLEVAFEGRTDVEVGREVLARLLAVAGRTGEAAAQYLRAIRAADGKTAIDLLHTLLGMLHAARTSGDPSLESRKGLLVARGALPRSTAGRRGTSRTRDRARSPQARERLAARPPDPGRFPPRDERTSARRARRGKHLAVVRVPRPHRTSRGGGPAALRAPGRPGVRRPLARPGELPRGARSLEATRSRSTST